MSMWSSVRLTTIKAIPAKNAQQIWHTETRQHCRTHIPLVQHDDNGTQNTAKSRQWIVTKEHPERVSHVEQFLAIRKHHARDHTRTSFRNVQHLGVHYGYYQRVTGLDKRDTQQCHKRRGHLNISCQVPKLGITHCLLRHLFFPNPVPVLLAKH